MKDKQNTRRTFIIVCISFILWDLSVVSVGVSVNRILDTVFLLFAEFFKMCTFIYGVELCAFITVRATGKKRSILVIASELLYFGIGVLSIRVIMNKARTVEGFFGTNLDMPANVGFILHVLFYVVVIFFYGIYTYMHYYSCSNRRESYISKQCAVIVGILIVALTIETLCYVQFKLFVPSMLIGAVFVIYIFRNLIIYKRSIEYNPEDYDETLRPLQEKPAFVCDDAGVVLFENTRAFVMRQTYRDEYIGKHITDIFEITDYDKERLLDARLTQKFEIYCKYPKEDREMLLVVKHNLDKFGDIFATEILIGYANTEDEAAPVVAATQSNNIEAKKKLIDLDLTYENIIDIRTKELIKLLELQKKLYDSEEKKLFEINLRGIEKASSVLGLSALSDLCGRIQTELVFGEWEGLNPMMIDLDRQYETLSFMNK